MDNEGGPLLPTLVYKMMVKKVNDILSDLIQWSRATRDRIYEKFLAYPAFLAFFHEYLIAQAYSHYVFRKSSALLAQ